MRQFVRYCTGGWPTSDTKRSCSAERDKPTWLLKSSIVHGAEGRSCSRASARPTKRSRKPASQPVVSLGQLIDVAANRVDEHHLAQALEHGFAAGAFRRRLGRGERRELLAPRAAAVGRQVQQARQRRDQRVERPQIAADEAADEIRGAGLRAGRRQLALEVDLRSLVVVMDAERPLRRGRDRNSR